MKRRQKRSKSTETLFPNKKLFRSRVHNRVRESEIRSARNQARRRAGHGRVAATDPRGRQGESDGNVPDRPDDGRRRGRTRRAGRERARKCVVKGTSGSVRVDLGGHSYIRPQTYSDDHRLLHTYNTHTSTLTL